ncbi:FG-GAP-like repeat-containing protein [Streptomyces sp. NPDC002122]|uniref:FG-GAP-like repeat-containing protein n=1 Tax=Streptomyces sp. NPDC002122 TaxID=3154407 RepID=UPI00331B38CD
MGYFCAWKTENATGTMFKTNKSLATLGTWNNTFASQINRTSKIACLYDLTNYELGTYWSLDPNEDPRHGYDIVVDPHTSSVKLVATERECDGEAYPTWYADTSPTTAGFGDLNGDRKADVLVRDRVGRLWYLPGGFTGKLVGAGGWNSMNAIVRHGDFSRDGREDVIAREASTGKLWLYPGTGTGSLGARKLVGASGWNVMGTFLSVGDFTGDGRADLATIANDPRLEPEHQGELRTYRGLGTGALVAHDLTDGSWWGLNGAF